MASTQGDITTLNERIAAMDEATVDAAGKEVSQLQLIHACILYTVIYHSCMYTIHGNLSMPVLP
jgi:hypothetical protein